MPITINGSGTVTGISAGGLPDGVITTDDIAANAVTQAKRSEQLTLDTAKASTSGTFIDFTGIPSWVKRVTVILSDVTTSGTSNPLVQLGSGSVTATGYVASATLIYGTNLTSVTSWTTGIGIFSNQASDSMFGTVRLNLSGSNLWAGVAEIAIAGRTGFSNTAGRVQLGGALDRIRITTVNGTDTFDGGTINIMYE